MDLPPKGFQRDANRIRTFWVPRTVAAPFSGTVGVSEHKLAPLVQFRARWKYQRNFKGIIGCIALRRARLPSRVTFRGTGLGLFDGVIFRRKWRVRRCQSGAVPAPYSSGVRVFGVTSSVPNLNRATAAIRHTVGRITRGAPFRADGLFSSYFPARQNSAGRETHYSGAAPYRCRAPPLNSGFWSPAFGATSNGQI